MRKTPLRVYKIHHKLKLSLETSAHSAHTLLIIFIFGSLLSR